jgi:hypothetical protein
MREIEITGTLVHVVKVIAASLITGAVAWEISTFSTWSQSGASLEKIGVFFASILGAVAVYFVLAKLLKIQEIGFLFGMIRRKAKLY